MAVYYITGIKKITIGTSTHISEVTLHQVEGANVKQATLAAKDSVIALIKAKHSVYTATWNYNAMHWSAQESVSYETVSGVEYLRSNRDSQQRDNLLHLLPLTNLGL